MHVPGTHKSQKRALDSLRVELQTNVSSHVGTENQNQVI